MTWSVADIRRHAGRAVAEKSAATAAAADAEVELAEAVGRHAAAREAQQHLQALAETTQLQAHTQVATIVSRCLEAVFDQPYELRVELERKRGRTEAKFCYLRDGNKVAPRVTSGGVMDVAALALRLTCLVLAMPPARRLLVLDEPFRALSVSNREKMARLLETLSREMGVQFILATHDESLMVGSVVRL